MNFRILICLLLLTLSGCLTQPEFETMTYANGEYGFSFDYPSIGYPLYDQHGNALDIAPLHEFTIFEDRVAENTSIFYVAPKFMTVEELANSEDYFWRQSALYVTRIEDESEIDAVLKEAWNENCAFTGIEEREGLDLITWDIEEGSEILSCQGGKTINRYNSEEKIVILRGGLQEYDYRFDGENISSAPGNLKEL